MGVAIWTKKIIANRSVDTRDVASATFTTVAEASKSAADVNDQYAQLKSTLNGLLAASAPYLVSIAVKAIAS